MRGLVTVLAALLASAALAASTLSSTLTWTAPTVNTDGTTPAALTYNVYEGPAATTLASVPVLTGLTTLTVASAAGAAPGAQACFAVTAVEAGQEGAQSNVVCKTFPLSVPGAPTLLTVK